MRRLSQIIVLLLFVGKISAQTSPHGAIKFDCSDCHVSTSWKEIPAQKNFKHEATKFALVGQHKNVDCKLCHSTLRFNEAKQECISCHKDIHKNTVSKDCSNCHTPNTWLIKNITDIHQRSRFPLLGQHAKADCQQCHTLYSELNFEPLGVKCYDCHKQNYTSTQNPNHAQSGFSTDCETCHNFTDAIWGYASFAHDFFPLQGGHKIATCVSCHNTKVGTYTGLSKDCYSCHKPRYEQTTNPNHTSAAFSTDCTSCHTINGWKPSSFNHTQYFTLVGAHVQLDCNKCHNVSYKNIPTDCYGCHKTTFEGTTNPNHVASKFPTDCTKCHTTSAWIPSTFNHASTNFPLTGMHISVDCAKCHASGYTNTPTDCYSCHKTNYDNTTNPDHVTSQFPTDCKQCHSTSGWKPASFDHALTQFPLTGAHTTVDCAKCHASGYTNTPTDCYSCHKTNYDNTTNPKHSTAGFSTDCKSCHQTTGWTPATFDHSRYFPITSGKHSGISCTTCHPTSPYSNFTCLSSGCHPKSSTDSDHIGEVNGYSYVSSECYRCHPTGQGEGAFNHSNSRLPLNGVHLTTSCESCHLPNSSTALSPDCSSCHQNSFAYSANPNHQVLGLSTDCKMCHTSDGWKPSLFDHASTTYQLIGKHATAACSDCHKSTAKGTSQVCYDCHQQSFANSLNPNHQSVGLSNDCKSCHISNGWTPSSFSHTATNFQLTGGHTKAACTDCHKGKTTGTSQVCYNCHQLSFANSVNPSHVTLGLSTDCKSCHTSSAWIPSSFNHATTNFQLTGKHTTVACADCHKGKTTGTETQCYGCHKTNFDGVKDPNHVTANFSTDCTTCHSTTAWSPSIFNHANTKFPLTGAHTTVSCVDCHATGYTNTPTDCYSCHKAKYDATTNPKHSTAGFTTACADCHKTTAWTPATFDHTKYFPIASGKHSGESCSVCHNTSSYSNFTCVSSGCHSKSETDSDHGGVNGYSYVSSECYRCHPAGKGGQIKGFIKSIENK
ncbi:MAG: hypothetical protein Q8N83_00825 [Ignavibacteria bacterium]|nr:hypothetical protein [Ignavibacteria bacterium]